MLILRIILYESLTPRTNTIIKKHESIVTTLGILKGINSEITKFNIPAMKHAVAPDITSSIPAIFHILLYILNNANIPIYVIKINGKISYIKYHYKFHHILSPSLI